MKRIKKLFNSYNLQVFFVLFVVFLQIFIIFLGVEIILKNPGFIEYLFLGFLIFVWFFAEYVLYRLYLKDKI